VQEEWNKRFIKKSLLVSEIFFRYDGGAFLMLYPKKQRYSSAMGKE